MIQTSPITCQPYTNVCKCKVVGIICRCYAVRHGTWLTCHAVQLTKWYTVAAPTMAGNPLEDLGDDDMALQPRLQDLLVLQGTTKSKRKRSQERLEIVYFYFKSIITSMGFRGQLSWTFNSESVKKCLQALKLRLRR